MLEYLLAMPITWMLVWGFVILTPFMWFIQVIADTRKD